MFPAELPENQAILKAVLAPLLDDFLYWFGLSLMSLENEPLPFMDQAAQGDLINRVRQAQAEVGAAKSLFVATDGHAGIDLEIVTVWHRLVGECWRVAQQRRQYEADQ
jgi:hypothetical protein